MKIYIWGTGYYSDLVLEFGLNYEPCRYIESRPNKRIFHNKEVISPDEMITYDAVVVANMYTEQIYAMVVDRHLESSKFLFICPDRSGEGNNKIPTNVQLAKKVFSNYNYKMYLMSRGLYDYTWYDAQIKYKDVYHHSYGSIENKPVMILRRHNAYTGIFSDLGIFLLYAAESIKRGYIPVIDRRDVANIVYQEREAYGIENAWEYYFYQPGNITLEDIEKGYRNVECWNVQDANEQYEFPNLVDGKFEKETIIQYHQLAKKLFKYKENVQFSIESAIQKYFGSKERILGVSIREGYNKSFALNTELGEQHRIQAKVQKYLEDAEKFMKEWELDYIFVACEAEETAALFYEKFGAKMILYDRKRLKDSQVPSTLYDIGQNYNQIDKRQHCIDYIIEIELLSRCTSLVCGATSGNNIAVILKEGFYEHIYCYDLGVYHYKVNKK